MPEDPSTWSNDQLLFAAVLALGAGILGLFKLYTTHLKAQHARCEEERAELHRRLEERDFDSSD